MQKLSVTTKNLRVKGRASFPRDPKDTGDHNVVADILMSDCLPFLLGKNISATITVLKKYQQVMAHLFLRLAKINFNIGGNFLFAD